MKNKCSSLKKILLLFMHFLSFTGVVFICLVITTIKDFVYAEDWTTYRHDNARSGFTAEQISLPLSLNWIYKPTHAPDPAWYEPAEELKRVHSDNAYHVSAANGMVYFGSSVDNKVYALNAQTGEVRWSFFTEGPVRCAPTIWKDRIFFGSDDGYVYCLEAGSGKCIWKYRAGSSNERVLGNGRMISLWPVRTNVLVSDGVVYFGAGVFHYEGIYICALNASDGSVVWKNDTISDRMYELSYGGMSPDGYLVISENILYVPSGRAMPAAFDKKSGQFLFYCLTGGKIGGTWAILCEGDLISGVDLSGTPAKRVYDGRTGNLQNNEYIASKGLGFPLSKSYRGTSGDRHVSISGLDLVITPDVSYTLTEYGIHAVDRADYKVISEKLEALQEEQRRLEGRLRDQRRKILQSNSESRTKYNKQLDETVRKLRQLAAEEDTLKSSICMWEYLGDGLNSLIVAGSKVFAGGNGVVAALNAQEGNELWRGKIDGNALGLAVSNGNLIVSTDKGPIYCFTEEKPAEAEEIKPVINASPYRRDSLTPVYEAAAESIVKEAKATHKGYCLVLGCGTGRLAYELARRTELKIIGIEKDKAKVEAAKRRLDEAGLYGSRIVVERWELSSLPDYFANLIVSDEMMISGRINDPPDEMFRVLKPCGGTGYFGQPAEASHIAKKLKLQDLLGWLRDSEAPEPESAGEQGVWVKVTRGRLEGAGSWTHEYANPQNTACSDDRLVKTPLGVLWFGEPGPKKMIERHAKSPAPAAIDGRLIILGENVLMAYDSYNGTLLWEKEIPGTVRARVDVDGSNFVVTNEGIFVASGDSCFQINLDTGEILHTYKIQVSTKLVSTKLVSPDRTPRRWGYLACVGTTLFGSTAEPMNEEYDEIWRAFVRDDGTWKNKEEIPPLYAASYEYYKIATDAMREGLWLDEGGHLPWEHMQFDDYMYYMKTKFPVPDDRARAAFQRDGTRWRAMTAFPAWGSGKEGAAKDRMMVSDAIFAVDIKSRKLKWVYRGENIAHISISIGDGQIFFAKGSTGEVQKEEAVSERRRLIEKGIYQEDELEPEDADVRSVVALDAATGEKLWERAVDLTGCGGERLVSAYRDSILLFFGSFIHQGRRMFETGALKWHRITALSAKSGEVLWSRPLNYLGRPLLVGDTIIAEPRACNIHTGKIIMRSHPITGKRVPWEFLRPGGGCGIASGSPHCLFYRSFSTAFYDIEQDRGVTLFGGIRPGCWINMIPANGLLLYPEASSGCTCSYPLRCSVALKHKRNRTQPWSVFIAQGPRTPVQRFAVNLGAPADMKDDEGTVWFGYPNPKTDYGIKYDLHDMGLLGMGYFNTDVKSTVIEGTDKPWLYASGCLGLLRCEMQLIDEAWDEGPGTYTVRLGFCAMPGDRIGQRIFDIRLQGTPVLRDFDILRDSGEPKKAVIKEFKGIAVKNTLVLQLVSKKPSSSMAQAAIINFIEVIREDKTKFTEEPQPDRSIEISFAEALLDEARGKLSSGNYEKSLEIFHTVLDGAPSVKMKKLALDGMAEIGSHKSLSRIARYCRDVSPIIRDYKELDPVLLHSAAQAYLAIAHNITEKDKQRAIKMLNGALTINNADIKSRAAAALKNLGVKGTEGK